MACLEPGMGLDKVLLAALPCTLMQEGEASSAMCSQRSRQLYCLAGENEIVLGESDGDAARFRRMGSATCNRDI